MPGTPVDPIRETVDELYRSESRRVLATLIRVLGDFDLAEDALHDAFRAALEKWPLDGVPANPVAWLISAGRFKAIDTIRKRSRARASLEKIAAESADDTTILMEEGPEAVEDDRLKLIFTCCHPALQQDAQVALTLREVCGLTTEEIARAFLIAPTTLAQRIVRAKSKIRLAKIPYQVPAREELPERLDSVLHVIYLVFNEGYSASSGDTLVRADLSHEAIRLGRLLAELLPETECLGLLALMLLHESRRTARMTEDGELILLENQDRTRWNRSQIEEGTALATQVASSANAGPYTFQAAISAVHATASESSATDWAAIVSLYDRLLQMRPSPVIELNRAVAIALHEGPAEGLLLIDAILARGDLSDYHLAHSARADLCRRLGRIPEARASYERALELARQKPERRFLQDRLTQLGA